jgi:hypothetical protein
MIEGMVEDMVEGMVECMVEWCNTYFTNNDKVCHSDTIARRFVALK